MNPGDRADYLAAQQDALQARIDANNDSMMGEEDSPTNLLTLPPEIREQIYRGLDSVLSHWVQVVKSKFPMVNSYFLGGLYRVCRLLHREIDEYLYKHAKVEFMTVPALELWRARYAHRLNVMTRICLNASNPLPIVEVAVHGNFSKLRTLWLERPCENNGGDYMWDVEHSYRRYGDYSVRKPTDRFGERRGDGAGLKPWTEILLLVWRQPEFIINSLEQFRGGTVQWELPADGLILNRGKYCLRFEVEDKQGLWASAWWRPIDVSVSDKVVGSMVVFANMRRYSPRTLTKLYSNCKTVGALWTGYRNTRSRTVSMIRPRSLCGSVLVVTISCGAVLQAPRSRVHILDGKQLTDQTSGRSRSPETQV
jgi:hypothetical protein